VLQSWQSTISLCETFQLRHYSIPVQGGAIEELNYFFLGKKGGWRPEWNDGLQGQLRIASSMLFHISALLSAGWPQDKMLELREAVRQWQLQLKSIDRKRLSYHKAVQEADMARCEGSRLLNENPDTPLEAYEENAKAHAPKDDYGAVSGLGRVEEDLQNLFFWDSKMVLDWQGRE
ncbi:uncharacterized protein PV07_12878, partial [Cladophialophora immunda]